MFVGIMSGLSDDVGKMSGDCRMILDAIKEVNVCWEIVEIMLSLSEDYGKIADNCRTTTRPFKGDECSSRNCRNNDGFLGQC